MRGGQGVVKCLFRLKLVQSQSERAYFTIPCPLHPSSVGTENEFRLTFRGEMNAMPSGKSEAWIIWSVLTAGAGLACFGLRRDWARFRQWRRLRAAQEGEIVFSDRALKVGQAVEIRDAANPDDFRHATICALEKRTLRLRLERQPLHAKTESPKRGTVLRLTVAGEGAIFRMEAPVLEVAACAEKRGDCLITVKRATWLTRIQRRNHIRIPIRLPAAFEFAHPTNRLTERTAQHGTVVDLSGGGLCADIGGALGLRDSEELLALLKPDTILRARLPIPALSNPPLVRICLSERVAVRGGLGVRVACEFLPMPSWEQELIVQHIFRYQREQAGGKLQVQVSA